MIKKILLSVSLGIGFLVLPVTMFAHGMCVIVENADSGNSTDYVSWDNGSSWNKISEKSKQACTNEKSGIVWVAMGPAHFECPASGSNDSGFLSTFLPAMDDGSYPWLTVFTQGDGAVLFDGNGQRDAVQPPYYASLPTSVFQCGRDGRVPAFRK